MTLGALLMDGVLDGVALGVREGLRLIDGAFVVPPNGERFPPPQTQQDVCAVMLSAFGAVAKIAHQESSG
jgi:hypothetical protein